MMNLTVRRDYVSTGGYSVTITINTSTICPKESFLWNNDEYSNVCTPYTYKYSLTPTGGEPLHRRNYGTQVAGTLPELNEVINTMIADLTNLQEEYALIIAQGYIGADVEVIIQ